ncbi:MAG: DUF3575 domain-containing protein [Tannerellaceae bacterium]
MIKCYLSVIFMMLCCTMQGQYLALKSNVLYLSTATLNVGLETFLSKQYTLDVSGAYNPWQFANDKMMKLWFIQPELRRWHCDTFAGHFYGLHAFYGEYNWSLFTDRRYQGHLTGGGLTYGYAKNFAVQWGFEASIGLGYAYLDYDKYKCGHCGKKIGASTKNYIGPTKINFSLIYFLK